MNNSRYNGAVSSIKWLTNIVDDWFIMIISLVAFFIISAALLKNACAGAYCANSNFWDKVHDAHQKAENYSIQQAADFFRNQGYMQTTPTGIRDFFLGLVPDIKAFTVFEDSEVEPKQYFMKAIPQMLACIIIGIFIYNGYYRDTASAVGSFGAESFERIMTNADPVALADRLYNTTGTPVSKYDDSQGALNLGKKTLAHQIYSAIITAYPAVNGGAIKSQIMEFADDQANSAINYMGAYYSDDSTLWKTTTSARIAYSQADKYEEAGNDYKTYRVTEEFHSKLNLVQYDSAHHVEDVGGYIQITIKATRTNETSNILGTVNYTMTSAVATGDRETRQTKIVSALKAGYEGEWSCIIPTGETKNGSVYNAYIIKDGKKASVNVSVTIGDSEPTSITFSPDLKTRIGNALK